MISRANLKKRFYALQIKISTSFADNLARIESIAKECGEGAIILTPEVAISGFCYQKMNEASEFSKIATERLLEASSNHYHND